MTQTRPDLISSDRLPHNALRRSETYLKRRMYAVENAAVVRQHRLFRAATRDLRTTALDLADQYGVRTLDRRRMTKLWREGYMTYANARLGTLLDAVMADLLRAASAAMQGAYYGRLWLLDMALKPTAPIHMPPLNADALLGTLTENVIGNLVRSLAGQQWREQVSVELADLGTKIRRTVTRGVLDALPVSEALQRVSAQVTKTFNRVQTLTRTVVNTVSSIASIAAYTANKDALDGYEWLTARDEAVCPVCRALDGKSFEFDKQQQPPPQHWNCRCTLVPRVKADALSALGTGIRATLSSWADALGLGDALRDFLKPTGT